MWEQRKKLPEIIVFEHRVTRQSFKLSLCKSLGQLRPIEFWALDVEREADWVFETLRINCVPHNNEINAFEPLKLNLKNAHYLSQVALIFCSLHFAEMLKQVNHFFEHDFLLWRSYSLHDEVAILGEEEKGPRFSSLVGVLGVPCKLVWLEDLFTIVNWIETNYKLKLVNAIHFSYSAKNRRSKAFYLPAHFHLFNKLFDYVRLRSSAVWIYICRKCVPNFSGNHLRWLWIFILMNCLVCRLTCCFNKWLNDWNSLFCTEDLCF